jgi:hypothetical protein
MPIGRNSSAASLSLSQGREGGGLHRKYCKDDQSDVATGVFIFKFSQVVVQDKMQRFCCCFVSTVVILYCTHGCPTCARRILIGTLKKVEICQSLLSVFTGIHNFSQISEILSS